MTERTGLNIRSATIAIATGVFATQAATAGPLFQGLGALREGSSFMSRANAISSDGRTVVGASRSASGLEAFRWTFTDGMVGLGDLPGGDFRSEAFDVSADGSVIVGGGKSATGVHEEAFRWEAGQMTGLGDFAGGFFSSSARGVSADGSVAVGFGFLEIERRASLWTESGEIVDLGDLPGTSNPSSASAVSANGSVVVGVNFLDPNEGAEAFRWTSENEMVGIGFLSGSSPFSRASSVSADGTIVVGLSTGLTGFRWTTKNGMASLGDFQPTAMSDDSSIIVGGTADARAVIWTAATGPLVLQNVLETEYGLDLTGWTLEKAWDISGDGTVIVGHGVNPLGRPEGWITVIPDPPTLSLVIAAVFLSLRKRRHRA